LSRGYEKIGNRQGKDSWQKKEIREMKITNYKKKAPFGQLEKKGE
jgi:hypothetical protein